MKRLLLVWIGMLIAATSCQSGQALAPGSETTRPPDSQIAADPYQGWATYADPAGLFSLRYPAEWNPSPDAAGKQITLRADTAALTEGYNLRYQGREIAGKTIAAISEESVYALLRATAQAQTTGSGTVKFDQGRWEYKGYRAFYLVGGDNAAQSLYAFVIAPSGEGASIFHRVYAGRDRQSLLSTSQRVLESVRIPAQ